MDRAEEKSTQPAGFRSRNKDTPSSEIPIPRAPAIKLTREEFHILVGFRPRVPLRKALCISLQYNTGLSSEGVEFHGSHSDATTISDFLVGFYKYDKDDIVVMTDAQKSKPSLAPTRDRILREMKFLVTDAQPGDRFVFHFSGLASQAINYSDTHGTSTHDVLWPVDVELDPANQDVKNGILDSEIRTILVDRLPPGAHCTMIFDCCSLLHAPDADKFSTTNPPQERHLISAGDDARTLGSQSFANLLTVEYNSIPGASVINIPENDVSTQSSTDIDTVADVTSWSLCMDQRSTSRKRGSGFFVASLTQKIAENPSQTRGELLIAVTKQLEQGITFYNAKKPRALAPVTYLRPQLGSTRRLDHILNEKIAM